MKKILSIMLAGGILTAVLTGCGNTSTAQGDEKNNPDVSLTGNGPAMEGTITVISREEGSGTRGAFVELTGVEVKGVDGNKSDNTTEDAQITNKTDVVLTNVAGDVAAIGYTSLGSLNDRVRALAIDGIQATAGNVKKGDYKLARPFNIATKGEPTGVAKDFISFVLSEEGQQVVTDNKYIAISPDAAAFVSDGSAGRISIGGSSSVSPVMEKLVEAYKTVNPNATIELQTSDSTAGMTGTKDGTFDIGMASRGLKDSESGLISTVIAMDGIAVIVNPENPIENISSEQVRAIYVGEITDWADVGA